MTIKKHLVFNMIIVLSISFFSNKSLAQEHYALLIGINQYKQEVGNLDGAKNDVDLLANALEKKTKIPKAHIKKLINRKATKQAIKMQWEHLIRIAKKGDTLIFSFSGHGYYEKDLNGDEAQRDPNDKYDEILLLSEFSIENPQRQQRIIDDELYQWFKNANKKGLRVIYLADTCYSGDSYRGNDRLGKVRSLSLAEKQQQKLLKKLEKTSSMLETSKAEAVTSEMLYTFSPVGSKQVTQEYQVGNKTYGILSWYFAEALSIADANLDNKLTHKELGNHIKYFIKIASDNFMFPEVTPLSLRNTALFSTKIDSFSIGGYKKIAKILITQKKKSPLPSGLYKNKQGYEEIIRKARIGEKLYFILNEQPKYSHQFYFSILINSGRFKFQCLPSSLLSKRNNYKLEYRADPPAGKQIIISLAVRQPSPTLQRLLDNRSCNITPKKLYTELRKLQVANYQLGITEILITK